MCNLINKYILGYINELNPCEYSGGMVFIIEHYALHEFII